MSDLALFDMPAAIVPPADANYIGSCRAKGCSHTTRSSSSRGKCPEHGTYRLERIRGRVSESHVCNWECLAARGPRCECSCGGANHGAWSIR